jgi:hypothetical protein
VDRREIAMEESGCGCWSLVTSAALAITFKLTPFSKPEPEPEPPPRPCPPPPAPQPLSLSLQLGAGALAGAAFRPETGFGAFGFLEVRWSVLSVGVEARLHPPVADRGGGGATIEASLYAAMPTLCIHGGLLFGCAVGEFGGLRLHGDAIAPEGKLLVVAALGVRGGLELPLGAHLAARVQAELLGAFDPQSARLDDKSTWKTPLWSGLLGGGVVVTF